MRLTLRLASALLAISTFAGPPAGAAAFNVDGVHSSVLFKIKHLGTANFYGAFKEVSGSVSWDPAQPETSTISLTIPAASIDSRNTGRDDHLKGPDFFNVKQFPNITFKSTAVKKTGEHTFDVTGELELHGTKKTVTASVEHTGSGTNPRSQKPIVGFEARLTIKRSDFGMTYSVGPASDDVEVLIALEAAAP